MTVSTLAIFGPLDWGVLAGYFAVIICVSFFVSRKKQDDSEYFLGGHSIPTWAASVSIVASMLSTATFVGVPDAAYAGDLTYLILNIGGFIAAFVVATLFVPRLYRTGTVTIYGYIAQRYGQTARVAVSCVFIFGRLLASGARLFLAAIPVCLLMFGARAPTLWQMILAICLIGAVGTFYTVIGGVRAVIWVDVIQFAIVIGAALLTITLLLHRIPLSFTQIFHVLAHSQSRPNGASKLHLIDYSFSPTATYTIWTAVFASTFLSTAAYGVDHDLAQRFLVTRSAFQGGLSVITSQLIGVVTISLFLCIGLLLYLFYQRPDVMHVSHLVPQSGNSIYPWFLLNELPTVLSGLAMAGFFAIAQGSMDSAMNALASSIVADLWLPLRSRGGSGTGAVSSAGASKFTVAAVGGLLCAFASVCAVVYDPHQKTLLDFALGVMTFAFSGLLGVFLTALFTRRGNTLSVIAALVVGALTVAMLQDGVLPWWTSRLFYTVPQLAWPWWMPIGTVASFICCVCGSPRNKVDDSMLR